MYALSNNVKDSTRKVLDILWRRSS